MSTGNKTRYLILGLLSESPLSGYEIKRLVDLRFSYFWNESYGQIYPELRKLTAEGLVGEAPGEGNKGKRPYSITEQGRSALREWLKQPVDKEIIRFELLLKLYFGNEGDKRDLEEHVREFRRSKLKQAEAFERFTAQIRNSPVEHDNHAHVLQVLLFGQKVWQAYLDWSDEVLRQFDTGSIPKE